MLASVVWKLHAGHTTAQNAMARIVNPDKGLPAFSFSLSNFIFYFFVDFFGLLKG